MKNETKAINLGEISDGYHTFNELYKHRITLYITLCRIGTKIGRAKIWRSKRHSDGSKYKGWFILGIHKDKGKQITYHIPTSKWKDTEFAETLKKAPEYDGHSPEDVLKRLNNLI